MHKRLTITIDEEVYKGLYRVIGKGTISKFIEDLVRPYVIEDEPNSVDREITEDTDKKSENLEWIEALIGDSE